MIRFAFVLAATVAVLDARPAAAQPASTPFAMIELSLAASGDVGASLFHDYWRGNTGAEATFATPFYLGTAEAGASIHRYRALRPDVPRFDAVSVYFGWGIPVRITPWLAWHNGLRLGNMRMTFDDDTFKGVRNESELLIGLHSRVEIEPVRNWALFASVTVQQVYTYVRLRPVYVQGGIRHRLRSPQWLEAFLQ